jgi:hypothetical protein
MHEMAVDIEDARAVRLPGDHVGVEDLVVQGLWRGLGHRLLILLALCGL